jgi:hypothetical protein
MTPNCSHVKTLLRKSSKQMSFPETVSAQTQTIPLVKKPDVEVLA